MPDPFCIDGTTPTADDPYTIAEMGTNHNRDKETARELIDVAANSGVDAVKYQFYHTTDIVLGDIPAEEYGFDEHYEEETVAEVYDKHLRLPREWIPELFQYASDRGLDNVATACCPDCVDFVVTNGIDALKVSSQDLTHTPLLSKMAETEVPVILSTGMASLGEIERALQALESSGADSIAILHCVSNYPTEPQELNLRNIGLLQSAFGYTTGFSDHSLSPLTGGIAVSQGACILEKHYTLDRTLPGPDHSLALEPGELTRFVEFVHEVVASLGNSFRDPPDRGKGDLYRRSVVAAKTIQKGNPIRKTDVGIARPGTGLPPSRLDWVVDREPTRQIEMGTALQLDDFC